METVIKWANIIRRVEDIEQDQHITIKVIYSYSAHEKTGEN